MTLISRTMGYAAGAAMLLATAVLGEELEWTWMKGPDRAQQVGVYGSQGVASPLNRPDARDEGISWRVGDDLWMFGGWGYDGSEDTGHLNDLWKYDLDSGQWTWMKGAKTANQTGTYGTQGVSGSANTPGGRARAVSWADGDGVLWLFGGYGCDGMGTQGWLNDLWKYEPAAHRWTWMEGVSYVNSVGSYGEQGFGNSETCPGARTGGATWVDEDGILWLFGGYGIDAVGNYGSLNDLWKYDAATGFWTWVKGANLRNQAGVYGTLGVASAGNTPGARSGASAWVDEAGMFWLLGGYGEGGGAGEGFYCDLWRYNPSTNQWTWMKGPNVPNQNGVYGTLGVASVTNNPGGRDSARAWLDSDGKLWLHGGYGLAASGIGGFLNDLWSYNPATGNWTWEKGANTANQAGVHGVQGVAAETNKPGARDDAVAWTDEEGIFWLFGGHGYDSAVGSGTVRLADLWSYDPATGDWTWEKGPNTRNQSGVYGSQGVAGSDNLPGGRREASAWPSDGGSTWLFGGDGYDHAGTLGMLNDLWRYDADVEAWSWERGSDSIGQSGSYGTQGVEDEANTPGGRYAAMPWTDAVGVLWLFGGYGRDRTSGGGYLNDLWSYDPATENWTWQKGADVHGQAGTYGSQGVPAGGNTPGGRELGVGWRDAVGCLWLFGGYGCDSTTSQGYLNDLWKYDPATGNWTWMKGASSRNQSGSYGTQGTGQASNNPGSRRCAVSWTDADGNFWLFGGYGYDRNGNVGRLNDLWKYDPISGNWTWMKGSDVRSSIGTYGVQGVAAAGNTPGARDGASAWIDGAGRLWLVGGEGYDSATGNGRLNDVWCYDPATGNWTWMKGSRFVSQSGTYGTLGTSDPDNTPGARRVATVAAGAAGTGSWWLFGGNSFDSAGRIGRMNDLWRATLCHAVRYEAEPQGSILGEAVQKVEYGGTTTPVTAEPGTGHHFTGWSDGSTDNPRQDATVTADFTVTATFAVNEYVVTFQTDGTPGASVNGVASFTETVTHGASSGAVTAAAPPGFIFTGWSGDAAGTANPLSVAGVTGNLTITANFAAFWTLTLHAVGNGATSPAAGVHTVVEGVPFDLAATPATGHHLVSWTGDAQAQLVDPLALQTTATVSGDAVITATFAINQYTVRFETDGTEGASLTGELVQTVDHGGSCSPVTAVPPDAMAFLGWQGDAEGMDNPLTVTGIVEDLTIVAGFGLPLATGSVFGVEAAAIDTLPNAGFFLVKPKVYSRYRDPVTLVFGKTASAKVLTKVVKPTGSASVACEWTKKVCLFARKEFKAAQATGTDAATWLGAPENQGHLPLAMRLKSVEAGDQPLGSAALMPPEIDDVADAGLDAKGNALLTVTGSWFGVKKPKVWREYTDDKTGAIKGQSMKVLAPVDPALANAKGKPACMDAATGASRVIVVVPANPPKGTPTGDLVLDNGVGLAVGAMPDLP
jgi:uncharacterized repeat protein (TIGR02543 family)